MLVLNTSPIVDQNQASMIDALLPMSLGKESSELNFQLTPHPLSSPNELQSKKDLSLKIGKLFLKIIIETTEAILDCRYRDTDALVKNFGCQITALQNAKTYKKEGLREQASIVQGLARTKLAAISANAPHYGSETTLSGYLKNRVQIDMIVPKAIAELARLRLLTIVNDNKLSPNNTFEIPFTNMINLCKKISGNAHTNQKTVKALETIVNGIQAEESLKAVSFIQKKALKLLENGSLRGHLLNEMVGLKRESKVKSVSTNSSIVSVPLTYNTEVVLRTFEGIFCIKNKLSLVGVPIPGAKANMIFINLQKNKVLSQPEIEALDLKEPLLVIEGFIKEGIDLASQVIEQGLISIVLANCASLNQYASGASIEPIESEEARDDLKKLAANKDAQNVIIIDHFYCSSVKEELRRGDELST